ncbi:hypothetical protein QBC39DRAFT_340929 [Podospora conica]|nr:hypothetical protein QBC39DRAFT_340929 [Schizothecium conicum]
MVSRLAHLLVVLRLVSHASAAATTPLPLNMTAISSRGGYSVLECWQLASVPVDAMSAANYALGDTTKATWSQIQPRTTVGEAWAPTVQLSIILNGLIRITSPAPRAGSAAGMPPNVSAASMALPDANDGVLEDAGRPDTKVGYIMPGTTKSSVLIAADLKSISTLAGHYTEFPSDEPTILVQIPFEGNTVPEHVVLYEGACV